ncbi:hypothetical protein CNAG_07792 [Cryptococcus neoformans var. grubii H99]|uniref:Uncharacterized protein n=1 Tax=Cryptococcus neoformans (strain H99 / ATCC 208821 / CBS 10515 / FGSC 9487) TaxID=235443 RepID=J9VL71_CRYN9|nr:hypothetical protein CNAG_07792 [Cryptococcus neoformans var. grubii H99]AFR94196.1 hypothetical protein CNAG_07792 [Cryptococcus neoformans var. grubii H99]AUB23817.1 hypothetical protein CKF44_07792 [Cryptococcus neoformans var. grubii]|eukprot:XP_012048864.1 hypothetical protein CNAG_07792 [Cryptococcus neoformans var. grubii H99]
MRSWVVYSAHWGDNWCGWWHLSQATFGCVWMRRQGGGMVHGGGQGGGCWRYSTLYRLTGLQQMAEDTEGRGVLHQMQGKNSRGDFYIMAGGEIGLQYLTTGC